MLCKLEDFLWRLRIQKDESPLNPYVDVTYDGLVTSDQDMKVISTCKMDIHKFPFDTQSCNITIGSAIYCGERERAFNPTQTLTSFTFLRSSPLTSDKELRFVPFSNSSRATQFSRELIKTQGEWEFLQLSVSRTNFTMQGKIWENLIYTVSREMRRIIRPSSEGPYFIPSMYPDPVS